MKLTPRERLLLIAFSSLFIVLIGGALVTAGVRTLSGLRQENALLSLRLDSLQAAVDQRPLWEQRDAWLNEHTTAFRTREEAAAVLLNWINNWAGQANIELLNREIVEAAQSADDQPEGYFKSATIRVTIAGTQEEVLSWVHSLQQPDQLIGVTGLTIDAGERFTAQVDASKWYYEGEE